MGTQFVNSKVNRVCSWAPLRTLITALVALKKEEISGRAVKEKHFPATRVVPKYFHSFTKSIADPARVKGAT